MDREQKQKKNATINGSCCDADRVTYGSLMMVATCCSLAMLYRPYDLTWSTKILICIWCRIQYPLGFMVFVGNQTAG